MLRHISLAMLLGFICCLLVPSQSYSEDFDLLSLSMRARVSEQTVLGKDALENFEEYDVAVNSDYHGRAIPRQAGARARV